jgi:hypothetical protein
MAEATLGLRRWRRPTGANIDINVDVDAGDWSGSTDPAIKASWGGRWRSRGGGVAGTKGQRQGDRSHRPPRPHRQAEPQLGFLVGRGEGEQARTREGPSKQGLTGERRHRSWPAAGREQRQLGSSVEPKRGTRGGRRAWGREKGVWIERERGVGLWSLTRSGWTVGRPFGPSGPGPVQV